MSLEPDFSLHPDTAHARAAAEALFIRTAAHLRDLLPATAEIRHVGATAVEGCLTKGDLDIVVRVPATDFAAADTALAACFARNTGSMRSDTFSAFENPGSTPHLGVQLTVLGAPTDVFHTFTELLQRDADLRARYNALKQHYDRQPMEIYRTAKSAFIRAALQNALDECS